MSFGEATVQPTAILLDCELHEDRDNVNFFHQFTPGTCRMASYTFDVQKRFVKGRTVSVICEDQRKMKMQCSLFEKL